MQTACVLRSIRKSGSGKFFSYVISHTSHDVRVNVGQPQALEHLFHSFDTYFHDSFKVLKQFRSLKAKVQALNSAHLTHTKHLITHKVTFHMTLQIVLSYE